MDCDQLLRLSNPCVKQRHLIIVQKTMHIASNNPNMIEPMPITSKVLRSAVETLCWDQLRLSVEISCWDDKAHAYNKNISSKIKKPMHIAIFLLRSAADIIKPMHITRYCIKTQKAHADSSVSAEISCWDYKTHAYNKDISSWIKKPMHIA